ncbi:MAG: pilus assembly protein CpaF [Phycisphaerales bacterium]|jgi:pilus assembly protein CpaF|nr:pilus assembly protein CpaF [Phycisphaerales bacterium]
MGLFTKNKAVVPPAPPKLGQDGSDIVAPPGSMVQQPAIPLPPQPPPQAPLGERAVYMQQLRVRIHGQLVERLDVQNLKTLPPDTVRAEVRILIRELCQSEKGLLTSNEQEKLMDDVMDETFGLGPLETLLKDPSVSDILVNRFDRIYVEKRGRLERAEVRFRDNAHLRQIIDRIVAQIGRRVDEISPMVDARLADGSRVNAIIPPLALDGPAMSIRRFGAKPLQLEDLIRHGAFPPPVMDFLAAAVQARCNVLISGGTGSGKTTLLNCLSRYIPADERVITIEDAAELQLQQPHVVRLETRPNNIEGKGEVSQRDLVRNCLRMRPDRVIIGECRGAEALDMLQAMNTGHEGSMTTVHANNTRDALGRLEIMVAMSGFDLPTKALRQQIASAIQIVVQSRRLTGGKRKVVSVSEITGMEGELITMHDLFTFEQRGVDEDGHAIGYFRVHGIRPRCADRIEARGLRLPPDLFARREIETG